MGGHYKKLVSEIPQGVGNVSFMVGLESMRSLVMPLAAEADARIEELERACRMAFDEMRQVLSSCNQEKVHFDGDDFHETLESLRKVLPKQ